MAEQAIRDLTSMAPRPPAAPPAAPKQDMESLMQRGAQARERIPGLLQQQTQVSGDIIRREQEGTEQIQKQMAEQEPMFASQQRSALEAKEAGIREEPELKPSNMEMDDYRNLAGMLVTVGILAGGKGRSSAMYALSALNGMMEGYAKGRKDLVKQNQTEFEKGLKAVDLNNKRVLKEYEDAIGMINKDRSAFLEKIKLIEANNKNGVAALKLRLNDIQGAISQAENASKASDQMVLNYEKLAENQRSREERERHAKQMERLQQEGLEIRRQMAESRQALATQGRVAAATEVRKIEAYDSLAQGSEQLLKEWNDSYAIPAGIRFLGNTASEFWSDFRRRFPDDKNAQNAAIWWARYERLQAPERHALFGSAFTTGEANSWRRMSGQLTDSPEIIKRMLQDQQSFARARSSATRELLQESGYREIPQPKQRNYFDSFNQAPAAKTMPEPKTLQAYADQKFNGNVEKARQFLKSQGYQ